jgi:hypothetical protein
MSGSIFQGAVFHSGGLASVTAGSDVVTGSINTVNGTETLWVNSVMQGDAFQLQGRQVWIKQIISNTQIIITEPWGGSTVANSPYVVKREVRHLEGSVVAYKLSQIINGIESNAAQYAASNLSSPPVLIVSSATTDIGALNSVNVIVTGNSQITSFGSKPNSFVRVRFTGASTLVHNSTSLILPGSSNLSVSNGDVIDLMSDSSGAWRVTDLHRNITNVPVSLASAATIDIGAANSTNVTITGTTGITSLGSKPNASVRVRFSGALTLTHNATSLALPNNANLVVGTDDIAEFMSDASGNWRCVDYLKWTAPVQISNVPVSLASAATVDIGAANSTNVTITGTTGITSLGSKPNAFVRLRFSGALTLTHNATSLALPNNANLVVGTDDIAEFMSDASGNWRCVDYLKWTASSTTTLFAFPRADLNLGDLMEELYGNTGSHYRTGQNAGNDAGAALILACTRLGTGYGRITIPRGVFSFRTTPTAAQLSGKSIISESMSSISTVMVWGGANNTNFLSRNAAGGITSYNMSHLTISREAGTLGGTAWFDQGSTTAQTGQITANDLYITIIGEIRDPVTNVLLHAAGRWTNNIFMSGNDRVLEPAGIRVANLTNIQCFQAGHNNGYSCYFGNVKQFHINSLGTYTGTGTLANNVYIGGVAGSAGGISTAVNAYGLAVGGELNITNTTQSDLRGRSGTLVGDATFTRSFWAGSANSIPSGFGSTISHTTL